MLNIKQTGTLLPDSNLLHPFIKIHIIDIATGKYLAKSNS